MEDGAVEAAEVAAHITKEVFNPLAKLTKGFQNVVLAKGQQNQPRAEQVCKGQLGFSLLSRASVIFGCILFHQFPIKLI